MGLEAATYINQLNSAWPIGASDPKAQGDDHLRLIKATIQASFPNISGAVTATHTQLSTVGGSGISGFAIPANKVKGSVVAGAGVATTGLRSDAQLIIDLADAYAWTGQHSWTQVLKGPAGAVGGPSFSFVGDSDTGIFNRFANGLSFASGGVLIAEILSTGLDVSTGTIVAPDGVVGTPSIAFRLDTDTGMWRAGANNVAFSAGGSLIFSYGTTAIASGVPYLGPDAALGAPTYSFNSDPDTGWFHPSANEIRLSVGATGAFGAELAASQVYSLFSHRFIDGVVGTPAIAFSSDTDTGIYHPAVNIGALAAGGLQVLSFRGDLANAQAGLAAGSAAVPALGFQADNDTGLYQDTANQIALALGGVTAGQIAQGTFVGTLTGFAAGPTGNVNWQRIGNHVTLSIPTAITGTSNSTAMTMTGMPAIIRPAATVNLPGINITDNSVNTNFGACSISAAGVITFSATNGLGGTGAFTNINTKGISAGAVLVYPVA
jgi:hypothetical protein